MYFTNLEFTDLWAVTSEDLGLSAGIDDGYVSIAFDWGFTFLSYPFYAGSGSGLLSVDDLYVTASFITIIDDDACATNVVTSCACSIGDFGLTLESDDINTSLINILAQLLSPAIADYVGDFLGDALGEIIVAVMNSGSTGVTKEIDEDVALDYHAPVEPAYTSQYESIAKTGFYYLIGRDTSDIPFDPPELPSVAGTDGIQLVFSHELFRSAWWCYAQLAYFHGATGVARPDRTDASYNFNLTVADLAALVPALSTALELDRALEVDFTCAYPNAMEPLYSGIYVETACGVRVATADAAALEVFAFDSALGLAEQPGVHGAGSIGLYFYYHNHTLVEVSAIQGVSLDTKTADELYQFLAFLFLEPFFGDWGEHIAFTLVGFDSFNLSEPDILFEPTYGAVIFEILLPD